MALQQQRPQPVRQLSFSKPIATTEAPVTAPPQRKRPLEDSQEWILFSPRSDHSQSATSQTPRTANLASDFGSLETHVRSDQVHESETGTCQGTELDDDGAELDSLDDGLHAFHHGFSTSLPALGQSGETVLPTHDGLGGFPSTSMQEQLWQFERYNPHRRKHIRRQSSVQKKLDAMEEDLGGDHEDEKMSRIEKWRLEQSRAVLEEIERETRRRKRRMSMMSSVSASIDPRAATQESTAARSASRQDSVIYEEPGRLADAKPEKEETESFWRRITRRVIEDLIGLDETTLSVIFGEELPLDLSPTLTQPSPIAVTARTSQVSFRPAQTWEHRLLERIARELGILVHQISEHEGAFSTYVRTQEEPEYAGLPILRPAATAAMHRRQGHHTARRQHSGTHLAPSDAFFTPTLPQSPISTNEHTDTSLWGIEEEPSQPNAQSAEAARVREEQDYWERDVDVRRIFSYLKRRFSIAPSPPAADGPLPASWTTTSALGTSPESLRRAEVIRQQHPLVSRAAERAAMQSRKRDSLLRRNHLHNALQRRAASSSCASQSTKRSRRSRSASSRNYWDLGQAASVGSVGSGPAMSAALGGWGEV